MRPLHNTKAVPREGAYFSLLQQALMTTCDVRVSGGMKYCTFYMFLQGVEQFG